MKNTKRLLCLLMCAVMVLSLLTACGGQSEEIQPTASTTEEATASTTVPEATVPETTSIEIYPPITHISLLKMISLLNEELAKAGIPFSCSCDPYSTGEVDLELWDCESDALYGSDSISTRVYISGEQTEYTVKSVSIDISDTATAEEYTLFQQLVKILFCICGFNGTLDQIDYAFRTLDAYELKDSQYVRKDSQETDGLDDSACQLSFSTNQIWTNYFSNIGNLSIGRGGGFRYASLNTNARYDEKYNDTSPLDLLYLEPETGFEEYRWDISSDGLFYQPNQYTYQNFHAVWEYLNQSNYMNFTTERYEELEDSHELPIDPFYFIWGFRNDLMFDGTAVTDHAQFVLYEEYTSSASEFFVVSYNPRTVTDCIDSDRVTSESIKKLPIGYSLLSDQDMTAENARSLHSHGLEITSTCDQWNITEYCPGEVMHIVVEDSVSGQVYYYFMPKHCYSMLQLEIEEHYSEGWNQFLVSLPEQLSSLYA